MRALGGPVEQEISTVEQKTTTAEQIKLTPGRLVRKIGWLENIWMSGWLENIWQGRMRDRRPESRLKDGHLVYWLRNGCLMRGILSASMAVSREHRLASIAMLEYTGSSGTTFVATSGQTENLGTTSLVASRQTNKHA